MLELKDVEVRIHRIRILRGVSLEVEPGTIVGLVGRNGAGKTTTLRSIMGLLRLERGAITFDGDELAAIPAHRRPRLGFGYMPEDRRLVPDLTVEQNVLLPAVASRISGARERLAGIYEHMPEVRQFATRKANQLSGGQQKLVALARALMVGRRVLLLDEPFEGLAPALAERMGEAIQAAQEHDRGLAVLLAESERRHVERLAARTYTIERGEVISGPGGRTTPVAKVAPITAPTPPEKERNP